MEKDTLWQKHRARIDIPLLALAALVIWGVGLTLPLVATEKLIGSDSAYSVLSGLWKLAQSSYFYLAAPLFLFSVAFPGTKLLLLLYTWFLPMAPSRRERLLDWLDELGRWSMLDVYVILITAGALQLGILAESVLREGIYVFGSGILLSMVAATLARGVVRKETPAPTPNLPERPVVHLPVVAAVSAGLFLVGISRPLLRAEKWVFWENQYSLLGAASGMINGGMAVLGMGFVLFVIVLPLVQQLLVLILGIFQWFDGPGSRLRQILLDVERWAMMDVVALALIIVFIRLGSVAGVEPQSGVWFLGGAVMLSFYASIRTRRLYSGE